MTTSPAMTGQEGSSLTTIQRVIRERVDAERSAGIAVGVVNPDGPGLAAYGDPGPRQPRPSTRPARRSSS
jgi:hypothetical protein